jgi:N-acetylneuraminic acid mutarotase
MRRSACSAALIALVLPLLPTPAYAAGPVLTWSASTPTPTSRYSTGVTTTPDGDMLVFGGISGGVVVGTSERFDPATATWTTLSPMPTPRNAPRAVTAGDGTVLVIGGFPANSDATSLVEAYDPATDTWSTRANLPTSNAAPAAVRGADGTIYVIGGYPGCCFGYLNSVYAYDLANNTWTSRAPMPTPRQSPGAAHAADGRIYVVGGNGSGPTDRVVEVYDPATNSWSSRAPMPLSGNGLNLVAAANGKLYAFGYDALGTVLEYDTAADTWTAVEPMPTPRAGLAAALAGDGAIYTAGGYDLATAQTTTVVERASFGGAPPVEMHNVAVATKATSTNQSITAAATTAVPAGVTVTVSVATGTFAGPAGCTDTKGNTYQVVADKNTGNGRLFVCSATLTTPLAAGDTLTATYPRFSGLSVMSVNAITAGGGAVAQASTAAGNSAAPNSRGVTPSQPPQVVFGVVAHNSVPSFTPAAGFTVVGAVTGGTGSGARTVTPMFRLATTTGGYAATGTLSGGQQWRAAVVTYA